MKLPTRPRLSGLSSLAAVPGLAIGALATLATFRWGINPIITITGFASLFLAVAKYTPLPSPASTALAVGLVMGIGIPIAATTTVAEPTVDSEPSDILGDAAGAYRYSISLSTVRECERDSVEVWARRQYTIDEAEGNDSISWNGVPPDLARADFQAEIFGSAAMKSGKLDTTRTPQATLCTESSGLITLGIDDSPDGKNRGRVWYHDEAAFKSRPVQSAKYVVKATQDPDTAEARVIMRRFDSNSLWCGTYPQPKLSTLQKEPTNLEWVPVPPDYVAVDYVYQEDFVHVLLVSVDDAGEPGELFLVKTRCDGNPLDVERLTNLRGDSFGEVRPKATSLSGRLGSPVITVGPNGETVLLSLVDLKFRVFEGPDEVSEGRLLHPGYTPSRSGVYGLTEPQVNGKGWLMYYATPKGNPDRASDENRIVPVRYVPVARCLRKTNICIKRG